MKFSFNRKQKKADTESGDGVQGALRISAEEDMKALSVGGRPFVFILLGTFILMICACAAAFFIMVKGAEEVLVPNVEGKDLASALLEMQIKELYPVIPNLLVMKERFFLRNLLPAQLLKLDAV